jgi:hypothetical protein
VASPIGAYTTYFVTGSATSSAGGHGGSYECNTGGHESYGSFLGCGDGPAWNWRPEATSNLGTVDSSGRTTAFFAQTQSNTFHTGYDSQNQPVYGIEADYSRARVSANLADGSLHAAIANNAQNGAYVAGVAQGDWHDIVTMHVAGANANTVTRVQFKVSVDGSALDNGQTTIYGQVGSGSLSTWFGLDNRDSGYGSSLDYGLYANAGWANQYGTFYDPGHASVDNRSTHAGGSWTAVGVGLMQFDGYFDILGDQALINPTLRLNLQCDVGLQCDYGQTAKFSFVGLPSSVSYTSDSGVFLTAAVPEPGSWALMLAGVAGLGCMARRRGTGATPSI